jgi:hypothetical protein
MSKTNRILSILLAVQIVVVGVVFFPRGAVAVGGSMFPGLTADQIVKLTIHDDAGKQLELAKGNSGWGLSAAEAYPVPQAKMDTFLKKLVGLQTDRPVTKTASSLTRLKVSDQAYLRLIEFELVDGTKHKLYLGVSPSYQVSHVRADDQDTVYLTIGLSESDAYASATDWADPAYFSVTEADIATYTLENKNGKFEFEKDSSGTWQMKGLEAGEEFNVNNLSSFITGITSMNMTEPLGKTEKPEWGMATPSAKVTITTKDKTLTLVVGAVYGDDAGYVVKSSESEYYAVVAKWTPQDWIDRAKTGFLKLPPTPEPSTTPTPSK